MTEQKQIEEMAKVIDEYTEPLSARDIHKADFSEKFAEALYCAGYRKQIEGEWVEQAHGELKCSECGIVQEDYPHRYNYCPNCGAKMRKEDD